MKKYIFILIVFVCTALPALGQSTNRVFSTSDATYKKDYPQLGVSPFSGGMVSTPSFSFGITSMRTSTPLSSRLYGGNFVTADSYITSNTTVPTIRRASRPDPDADDKDTVGPLSDGTWCLLALLMAYVAYLIYRKRGMMVSR